MRYKFILSVAMAFFLIGSSFSQSKDCDIKNLLHADGTMYYYLTMDTFYFAKTKSLMGGMITDKENFFLTLQPKPAPAKIQKLKDYKPLTVRLANDTTYTLDFFDARFVNDSVYVVMYMLDLKKQRAFLTQEVESLTMDTPLGSETFDFILHKGAMIHQLDCLSAAKKKL